MQINVTETVALYRTEAWNITIRNNLLETEIFFQDKLPVYKVAKSYNCRCRTLERKDKMPLWIGMEEMDDQENIRMCTTRNEELRITMKKLEG